jgi:hypothetical protein
MRTCTRTCVRACPCAHTPTSFQIYAAPPKCPPVPKQTHASVIWTPHVSNPGTPYPLHSHKYTIVNLVESLLKSPPPSHTHTYTHSHIDTQAMHPEPHTETHTRTGDEAQPHLSNPQPGIIRDAAIVVVLVVQHDIEAILREEVDAPKEPMHRRLVWDVVVAPSLLPTRGRFQIRPGQLGQCIGRGCWGHCGSSNLQDTLIFMISSP